MELDRRWQAVFEPGKAEDYFASLPAIGDCAAAWKSAAFDADLAFALSELSRLAYQPLRFLREQALKKIGLRELDYVEVGSTGCLVAGDELRRVFAFRGTRHPRDWLTNLDALTAGFDAGAEVHRGFRDAFASVEPRLKAWIDGFSGPVYLTGHSLGGALATLAAARLAAHATYTFGAPKVGTATFAVSLDGRRLYRVVNDRDIVPHVPSFPYRHAGEAIFLDDGGRRCEREPHETPPNPRELLSRLLDRRFLSDLMATAPAFLSDHAPVNYSARLSKS